MGNPLPRDRLIAACTAFVALLAIAWQVNRWMDKERARQLTEAALEARDLHAARQILDQRLRDQSHDGETLAFAAQVARRLGEFDDAAELLNRAERAGASDEVVALERALAKVQTGESGAVGHYLEVAEQNPDLPVSKLLLEAIVAGALVRLDLPVAAHAIQIWDKSATTAEFQALSAEWKGEISIRRGEVNEAADAYRRAIELAPTVSRRLRLADLLARQEPTAALAQLDLLSTTSNTQATKESNASESPQGLLIRARCQRALGDAEQADAILVRLLAIHPDHYDGLVERGQLALEQRRNEVAETCLQAAVAQRPQGREALQALARCLQLAGKSEEAREVRERVAQIDKALDQRIRQLQQLGRIQP
ncbi:MAG: tetratricopeptide repeat protein [Pirellulales bacterium]